MASKRSRSPGPDDRFSSAVQSCLRAFEFLTRDFGFRLDKWEATKTGFEIRYKSRSIGLRVKYQIRDNFLVLVSVLGEDGEFPKQVGELRPDSRVGEFDLVDIEALAAAAPPSEGEQTFGLPDADGIEARASRLRAAAADLLAGDLRRVPLLEQRVLARAEEMAWRKWGDRAVEFGWKRRNP